MYNIIKTSLIKEILSIIIISMIGCTGIIFSVLYVDTFSSGVWYDNSSVITAVSVSLISVLTVLTITFLTYSKKIIYRLCLVFVSFISILIVGLYVIKVTGFLDKISSVEDFRKYVSSFGGYAVFLFVLIQFLQVVVLPIPSFVTVGAGVLLFGPFKGAIFSCLGIILGSVMGFLIGRIFGLKVVKWLIGEDNLIKALKIVKGKDKIILTFMFLFPFFPDDLLCFVSGVTTVSSSYFLVMIFITRTIAIFVSSYSMSNSIIPYDTWWGILLWVLFFALTILLTIIIYKKGDVIEKKILKIKKRY